jgi:nucleotide-binding universal stress UspA family protein
MPRFILLPATGSPDDAPVFGAALEAARLFGAHLAFLHVRPDVHHHIASLAAGDMGLGTRANAAMAAMEQTADVREHAAAAAWRAFCDREGVPLVEAPSAAQGVSAEWLTEVGSQPAWLAAHGRAADLIVMGRRAEGRSVALDVLETVLMATGRPVLIASDKPPGPLADTVAIAWKDTPDAASAVWAALPFARVARRVIVFTVEEEPGTGDRSDRRVLRALRWSNPNTSVQALKRDGRPPVEVLLRAAVAAGSTLLAMGCYGHGRLREAVFGGFTRAVLERAPLPVLMAH